MPLLSNLLNISSFLNMNLIWTATKTIASVTFQNQYLLIRLFSIYFFVLLFMIYSVLSWSFFEFNLEDDSFVISFLRGILYQKDRFEKKDDWTIRGSYSRSHTINTGKPSYLVKRRKEKIDISQHSYSQRSIPLNCWFLHVT